MQILTVRPQGMSRENWKAHQREQKKHIARRISRPIWFAAGLKRPAGFDANGKQLYQVIVYSMGTYRRGMKTLADA